MMSRLAWLAFVLPVAAQIQVFNVDGPAPVLAGASVNLGAAPVRETSEFRFRVVNAGGATTQLQTLAVNGVAFSLAAPFAAVNLPAGGAYEFAVRFAPAAEGSYSATLSANAFTTLIRATAVPGPALLLGDAEIPGGSAQVNVPVGQRFPFPLTLANRNAAPLVVNEISLSGAGFTLAAPPLPLTVAPGESVPLPVTFTAETEGEYPATLVVGPRRLRLLAVAFRPKMPVPRIVPSSAVPRNGQQLKISLQLEQPAVGPGTGTLRVSFSGDKPDPAIMFANGAREVAFEVAAGSRNITFDGAPEAVLQTGTTTGTLRLEAVTESGSAVATYRFDPAPVTVDTATARRNGPALEIDLTGFDNTRGVGSLNFRFFDRAGNPLGIVTSTPAEQFKAFFDQSNLGGVFRLRASFPVTGDATIVGSVIVEIANSVGRTDLPRLNFP